MRILRVMTRLNLGGPARQALASDPLLRERGHGVRLLTGTPEPGEGDLFERFLERGLDVVRVPGLRRGIHPLGDLRALRFVRRQLDAFAPDVLHTHASKAGTLGRRAAGEGARRPRLARVHTFHGHVLEGYFPAAVSRRLVRWERRLAAATDRVLAVSHATADDLVRLGVTGEERLVVVPPGVELEPFLAIEREPGAPQAPGRARLRELLGLAAGDVAVGVIGRLAEVKEPRRALEVFELLRQRQPGLHLVFVGDGDQRRDVERGIAALGEDGERRVHILGAREDMAEVLAALDAVLSTSRSEGMPVALIEAAAAGLPAVATPVGGVPEVVVHERTGFLGATPEELAFGLEPLLADPEERRAMGARARLRIAGPHSAERLAARLEEVYRAVVDERAERGGSGA